MELLVNEELDSSGQVLKLVSAVPTERKTKEPRTQCRINYDLRRVFVLDMFLALHNEIRDRILRISDLGDLLPLPLSLRLILGHFSVRFQPQLHLVHIQRVEIQHNEMIPPADQKPYIHIAAPLS